MNETKTARTPEQLEEALAELEEAAVGGAATLDEAQREAQRRDWTARGGFFQRFDGEDHACIPLPAWRSMLCVGGAATPDARIYWHAHRGWQVEWLTTPPNGGQSNYYRALDAVGSPTRIGGEKHEG